MLARLHHCSSHAITHRYSMELLSTSNSTLTPIFKHWLPHSSMDFCLSPYCHYWTAFFAQPSINMSNPVTSSPYLRTPLTLRWKTSPSPTIPSSWNSPSSLLDQPFNVSSAPSWHSLLFLSLHPWHPLWFLSLHLMILPSLLSFLLTHYFLHFYDPRDHIIGRGHHGSQEGNMLCQGRGKGLRPLLYHLLCGLHRSWVLNSSQLRSSDRP